MLTLGVMMALNPIAELLGVVPLLGPLLSSVASLGICVAALGLAVPLALVTVATAWLYYRPAFAVTLIALAAVPLLGLHKRASDAATHPGPRHD